MSLLNVEGNSNLNSIGKFVRMPKYIRILNIVRASKLFKSFEENEFYKEQKAEFGTAMSKLIKILKSFLILIIACHFMSCLVTWIA